MRKYAGAWLNFGASSIELDEMLWLGNGSDNARARKRHLPHNKYFFRYLNIKMRERGPVLRFKNSAEILEDWRW